MYSRDKLPIHQNHIKHTSTKKLICTGINGDPILACTLKIEPKSFKTALGLVTQMFALATN